MEQPCGWRPERRRPVRGCAGTWEHEGPRPGSRILMVSLWGEAVLRHPVCGCSRGGLLETPPCSDSCWTTGAYRARPRWLHEPFQAVSFGARTPCQRPRAGPEGLNCSPLCSPCPPPQPSFGGAYLCPDAPSSVFILQFLRFLAELTSPQWFSLPRSSPQESVDSFCFEKKKCFN